MTTRIIPPHGGYENLLSYQKAVIVYDGTVRFCERFLNKRDRTYDQMVQAARSGVQNIAEGSRASGTFENRQGAGTFTYHLAILEWLGDWKVVADNFQLRKDSRHDPCVIRHNHPLPKIFGF